MGFRSIETLARDVLAKLEMQGCGCSDERAPAPAYPVTGMEVARPAGVREGTNRTRHAQAGEEVNPAAQSGIKGGEETVGPTELPQPTKGVFATSYGVSSIETATVSRRKRTVPQGSAVVVSMLEWKRVHASQPIA